MAVGISIVGAGMGVVFVVASATALGRVDPREAGLASGILSTFHEFGASLGAAAMSSIAASSIAGQGTEGFARGFTAAASIAGAAAVATAVLAPRRRTT